MKGFIKWMNGLPKLLKIVFALPVLDIIWAIFRLCKSIDKKNTLGIVLGILMIILCPAIFWLVDIITIIVLNRVLWID